MAKIDVFTHFDTVVMADRASQITEAEEVQHWNKVSQTIQTAAMPHFMSYLPHDNARTKVGTTTRSAVVTATAYAMLPTTHFYNIYTNPHSFKSVLKY